MDETDNRLAAGIGGGRHRLLRAVPEGGVVSLADRAVTRIDVTGADPLRIVVPPELKGALRDFFVRLVVTSDAAPEVTFAAPEGEAVRFEGEEPGTFGCDVGVNLYAFSETDQGVFAACRRVSVIEIEVDFDPCGGELDDAGAAYRLGAEYWTLPEPTKAGFVFDGWFTDAEGGVQVLPSSRCSTGVRRLYAHWREYVDPFAEAICPNRDLSFVTGGDAPWTIDTTSARYSAPGSARSGAIGDNGTTSLSTSVTGRGTLEFWRKTLTEENYDVLRVYVDGEVALALSGDHNWTSCEIEITTGGPSTVHAVEWRYTKDYIVSRSPDCVWIDNVTWTPETDA